MRSDSELKKEAFDILSSNLGLVDAERFISLLHREDFDYTQWRKNVLPETSVRELSSKAMNFHNSK
jgi:hypothetical protein